MSSLHELHAARLEAQWSNHSSLQPSEHAIDTGRKLVDTFRSGDTENIKGLTTSVGNAIESLLMLGEPQDEADAAYMHYCRLLCEQALAQDDPAKALRVEMERDETLEELKAMHLE